MSDNPFVGTSTYRRLLNGPDLGTVSPAGGVASFHATRVG
jgi:hypothetical protein